MTRRPKRRKPGFLMLRDVIAIVAAAVAIFWSVVWFIAAPALGILWTAVWAVVLASDYHLHRTTAPPVPVVTPEVVGTELKR